MSQVVNEALAGNFENVPELLTTVESDLRVSCPLADAGTARLLQRHDPERTALRRLRRRRLRHTGLQVPPGLASGGANRVC